MKKGFVGTENTELRKRLAAEGFLPERIENENGMFDDELEQAVRRYQLRYGLDADGVVGPRTLSSLAVSIEERTLQIVMNMERWRWLPQTLGKRHVMVNIADFRLEAVDDGTRVLEMKAIVGKGYRRTPVFSDQIRYLVLNPTWNIPPSIAVKDKLPLIKEDPSYLKVQKIRVFKGLGADMQEIEGDSIDWSTVKARGFPYSLRQDPGPHNALGRIKFMFPNKYNVYLHDTPSRELFGKSSRSFSSGCVRIEKPVELAAYFLLRNTQWSYEAIQGAIDKGTEQTIKLGQPVPVHLLYWTAFPDDSGSIQFRPDIYGRDLLLKEAWLSATPPADNPLQ
ncbi:MAG: L,D-transpeptidase family protein [Desulfofustis sp.]